MQEQAILDVIQRLKTRKFSFMSSEDVAQEAWVIANEVVKKWDGIRPIENFLMHSISRRLISLSRNYYRNENKREVIDFRSLVEDRPFTPEERIEDEVDLVLSTLPPPLRRDFLRLANGVILANTRKDAVYLAVKEILNDD